MTTSSATESVGLFHAKTHLSELVERVAHGESIAITKHGRKVAVLVPVTGRPKKSARQLAEEYFAMLPEATLGEGLTIKDLIEEGRR